jgi:hypothetical protein
MGDISFTFCESIPVIPLIPIIWIPRMNTHSPASGAPYFNHSKAYTIPPLTRFSPEISSHPHTQPIGQSETHPETTAASHHPLVLGDSQFITTSYFRSISSIRPPLVEGGISVHC